MFIDYACNALRQKRLLVLDYGLFRRSVEVHSVGYSKFGHPMVRAWQVGLGNGASDKGGWKLLRLDEARAAEIGEEPSLAPRTGYKLGDPAIHRIVCEL